MGYSIAALASEREVARHDSQRHKQPRPHACFHRVRTAGVMDRARAPRGCNSFGLGTQTLPTNLAHLSVIGARLALGPFASVEIAQEFIDASLVGSGIGDADTGIVGVCWCWWNAEGCQCYGCRRRQAHHCPLHQFSFSDPPNGRIVVATDTVSHFHAETDSAERKPPGQHSREARAQPRRHRRRTKCPDLTLCRVSE
jgi:hypothetical protein